MINQIYTLSMECVRGAYLEEEFLRVIEVSSCMRLSELHLLIQDLIGFTEENLEDCFIATRLRGQKTRLVTPRDLVHPTPHPEMNMTLADIFPSGARKKLYYSFDFGDNWIFEIKKKAETNFPGSDAGYPRIILQEGAKPM